MANKQLPCSFSEEDYSKISELAKRKGISKVEVVRRSVEDYLKKEKSSNDIS